MREGVKELAVAIANEQLEHVEYMGIFELAEGAGVELGDKESTWIYEAVTGARTTLDPKVSGQIKRLQYAVHKLAAWQGVDLSELWGSDYEILKEGDMD